MMTSTELQALKDDHSQQASDVTDDYTAAVTRLTAYEVVQNRTTKDQVCAALADLKAELQEENQKNDDAIAAINSLMADIGCGA